MAKDEGEEICVELSGNAASRLDDYIETRSQKFIDRVHIKKVDTRSIPGRMVGKARTRGERYATFCGTLRAWEHTINDMKDTSRSMNWAKGELSEALVVSGVEVRENKKRVFEKIVLIFGD